MKLVEIRCQEKVCPYGKQLGQRCVLGEVCAEDLVGQTPIRERHKCPRAKKGQLEYIIITLKAAS